MKRMRTTHHRGWEERHMARAALVRDIVASIRDHGARGVHRQAHEYTPDLTTQQLVNDELSNQQW